MKELWRLAHEEFVDKSTNPEIQELNSQIDGKLRELLSEEDFDEIDNLNGLLQSLIDQHSFKAGFEWGGKR